mmetsp:Transcript_2642/g.3588  ORF Transcript_2642/g.3588 Transcript_2642/m.3588 type:complete len:301 (-) Transcript_2642:153-1055(-)|eukprot:CAMPEP_0197319944 /NCGR_PEP_ID=MMETSP0891-20130614/56683_1 /TAXON_ID=44058 ORGANISM="Aureoumbra lagunensis, Strain CCMP1510" /NCGR_SAMPLE_ID=MMETSP0891 /ASSEMBLY_ACC=CAM_ASM_000534 /LENGTH=300 /DNA_ID=CAMNT_0042811113 /DNA_START=75 /DNA_END=977 /DNA_ORIENTATION=+
MSSFYGIELSVSKPCIIEPDEVSELQLSRAVLVKGTNATVEIAAEDGKFFRLCTLSEGRVDQAPLSLLLGCGNKRINLSLKGDKNAVVHISGYMVIPQNVTQYEEPEKNDKEPKMSLSRDEEEETQLARKMLGDSRLVDDDSDDDSDDEDFVDPKQMKNEFGFEQDEEDLDDSDDDDSSEADEDEEEEKEVPTAVVKANEKRKSEMKPTAEPASKKKKSEETPSSTPVSKPAIQDDSTPAEKDYKEQLVTFLKKEGKSPLSKIGSECRKPKDVRGKLKTFLQRFTEVFSLEGNDVTLKSK